MAHPTYVNSNKAYSGGGTAAVPVTLNGVTAGNLLIAACSQTNNTTMSVSASGMDFGTTSTGGDAVWTLAASSYGTGATEDAIEIYWAYAHASTNYTVQMDAGDSDGAIMLLEYTNVATSSPIDNTTNGKAALGGMTQALTAFTVANNTTVVACFSNHTSSRTYTFNNSFVERIDDSSATQQAGDLYCDTGGSITPQITREGTDNTVDWVGAAISINAPGNLGTVLSKSATSITSDSASAGGIVTSAGADVTDYGFCWSSVTNPPTIADSHTHDKP